jgi:MinD-like ATPase involved in chromosome partitioning or flagellar assembly
VTTIQPTRSGKITVATCVEWIFARARQDDRVAIDADTASGTLGAWVDPHTTGS